MPEDLNAHMEIEKSPDNTLPCLKKQHWLPITVKSKPINQQHHFLYCVIIVLFDL